jgi:hypothetical protein
MFKSLHSTVFCVLFGALSFSPAYADLFSVTDAGDLHYRVVLSGFQKGIAHEIFALTRFDETVDPQYTSVFSFQLLGLKELYTTPHYETSFVKYSAIPESEGQVSPSSESEQKKTFDQKLASSMDGVYRVEFLIQKDEWKVEKYQAHRKVKHKGKEKVKKVPLKKVIFSGSLAQVFFVRMRSAHQEKSEYILQQNQFYRTVSSSMHCGIIREGADYECRLYLGLE